MDRRLIILALGMFALGTDSFVIAGVLPQLAQSLHIGIPAAGQLTTAYALAFAVLAPVLAALTAHVPRKTLLLGSLTLFTLANVWTAASTTLTTALLSRALAGFAAALFSPTAAGAAASLVAPERRGKALAVVIAGMTISTAIGAPLGTFIGGLFGWRCTMLFVAALAMISATGIAAFLARIPMLPPIPLAKRLAPIADPRVGLTLMTTTLFFCAAFVVYTYFSAVFARVIDGSATRFGLMLALWGAAGTVTNLGAGDVLDKHGSRRVLVAMLVLVIVDFALLPWSAGHSASAVVAIAVWGACGWGILVPQQHRLVNIAPRWRRCCSGSTARPLIWARPAPAYWVHSPCSNGVRLRWAGWPPHWRSGRCFSLSLQQRVFAWQTALDRVNRRPLDAASSTWLYIATNCGVPDGCQC